MATGCQEIDPEWYYTRAHARLARIQMRLPMGIFFRIVERRWMHNKHGKAIARCVHLYILLRVIYGPIFVNPAR